MNRLKNHLVAFTVRETGTRFITTRQHSLLAMQSVVLAIVNPSVRPSVTR